MSLQEPRVLKHHSLQFAVQFTHLKQLSFLLAHLDQVKIFLNRRWLDFTVALAAMCAAFQVESGNQLLSLHDLQRILHQHDGDRLHQGATQCENTIDFGEC